MDFTAEVGGDDDQREFYIPTPVPQQHHPHAWWGPGGGGGVLSASPSVSSQQSSHAGRHHSNHHGYYPSPAAVAEPFHHHSHYRPQHVRNVPLSSTGHHRDDHHLTTPPTNYGSGGGALSAPLPRRGASHQGSDRSGPTSYSPHHRQQEHQLQHRQQQQRHVPQPVAVRHNNTINAKTIMLSRSPPLEGVAASQHPQHNDGEEEGALAHYLDDGSAALVAPSPFSTMAPPSSAADDLPLLFDALPPSSSPSLLPPRDQVESFSAPRETMAVAAKVSAAMDAIDAAYAGAIRYTTRSPPLGSVNALPLLIATASRSSGATAVGTSGVDNDSGVSVSVTGEGWERGNASPPSSTAPFAPFSPAKPQAVLDQEAYGFLFTAGGGSSEAAAQSATMRNAYGADADDDDGDGVSVTMHSGGAAQTTAGAHVRTDSSSNISGGKIHRSSGHVPSTVPTLDTYLSAAQSDDRHHHTRYHDQSNSTSATRTARHSVHAFNNTINQTTLSGDATSEGIAADVAMSRSEKVAEALRHQYYADKAEERTFYELQSYLADVRRRKEAQREDLLANYHHATRESNSTSPRAGSASAVGHHMYRASSSYLSIAAVDQKDGGRVNEDYSDDVGGGGGGALMILDDGVVRASQASPFSPSLRQPNGKTAAGGDGDSLRAVSVATTDDPLLSLDPTSSSSQRRKQSGAPSLSGPMHHHHHHHHHYGDNPFLTAQQRQRLQRWRSNGPAEEDSADRGTDGDDAEKSHVGGRSPSPSDPDSLRGDANNTNAKGNTGRATAAEACPFDMYDVFAPHVSAENARRQSRAAHIQNNASLSAKVLDPLSSEEGEMRESIIRYWAIAMRRFYYEFSTHPKTARLFEQRISVGLPSAEERARCAIAAEEAEAFGLSVVRPFYRGEAPPLSSSYFPPTAARHYVADGHMHSHYASHHPHDHPHHHRSPSPRLIQQQLITYTVINPHYRGAMFLWLLQPLERSEMTDRHAVAVAAMRRAEHLHNVFVEEGRLLVALYGGSAAGPTASSSGGARHARPCVSTLLGRSGGNEVGIVTASSPSSPHASPARALSQSSHQNPSPSSPVRSMLWHYATHDRLDPLEATPEEAAHAQHERRLTEAAYGLLARHRMEEVAVLLGQLQRHHGASRQRLVWEEEAAFEALIASPMAAYLREERQWAAYASSEGPAQSLVRSVFGRDTAMQREPSLLRY